MSTAVTEIEPQQSAIDHAPPNGSQTAPTKRLRLPTHLDLPITEEEAASGQFPTFEEIMKSLPTHLDLPFEDNRMHNFLEHPQSMLLTEAIWPTLEQRHPDGQFVIAQDSAIYWRYTEPPQKGAVSPDWYYVPNVPPLLNGDVRRSYVLWNEFVSPMIVIEFISDTFGNEYDRTPYKGKFWVYEQAVHVPYYAIFTPEPAKLDVYHFEGSGYQLIEPNARGHYSIPLLGVELGLWRGVYRNMDIDWIRWWREDGEMLLTGEELVLREAQRAEREAQRAEHESQRAEREAQRAEHETQRAEHETQRAERLAAKLRALGIDPNEDEPA